MTTIRLRPQPGPQTEFCQSDASLVFYGGSAGGGKALALDTPIATPSGWSTMGQLKAGDYVFGMNGRPVLVEAAHPVQIDRPCYRVEFDDGSSIVADDEHLWLVEHGFHMCPGEIKTTGEIAQAPPGSHRVPATTTHPARYITSVESVESVPVRCIKVADPSGMFLAGRNLIPTHNTFALLLELARHHTVEGYSAILFRKTFPQIKNPGGLWDTAVALYSQLPGVVIKESALTIEWPKYRSKIAFSHLQHEQDKQQHQGAQYPVIGFDEVTHFSKSQFMYLFSRNRLGMCAPALRPYIRATCNPEPGWVRDFLAPWIDPKYPVPAASGEIRHFFVRGDNVEWVYPEDLVLTGDPLQDPKSATFIRSTIFDNKALLEADPGYLTQLNSLNAVEKARLLHGRWDVEEGDRIFDRSWFKLVTPDELPKKFKRLVRYWDLAGTSELEKNGYRACWTAGVLMGLDFEGKVWILDVTRFRLSPSDGQERIKKVAENDRELWGNVEIRVEQEPGSAGKFVIESYAKTLLGHRFEGDRPTGEKTARWGPLASFAKTGHVSVLRAPWNEAFLSEVDEAPFGAFKDQVDAAAGAFSDLATRKQFAFV